MENRTLFQIAIICSLAGIFLLILISNNIIFQSLNETPETKISEITSNNLEEQVKIKGVITNLVETESITILNVKDNTGEITAIAYQEDTLLLSKNQLIIVEGEVIEYKGKLEVEANLIKAVETSEI